MSDLLKIVLALAAQASRHAPSPRPTAFALAGGVLAAIMATMAAVATVVFALMALWLYVATLSGRIGAALAVATALLTLCLAGIMAAKAAFTRPKPQKLAATGDGLTAGLAAGTASFIKDNQAQFLMAAFVAGILAARSKN